MAPLPATARKGRGRAAKEQTADFLNLCVILAEDKEFLTLLSECTDPAILNDYVFARAQVAGYKGNVAPANAFTKVKTLLGSYSYHDLPTSIQHLRESFQAHSSQSTTPRLRAHHRKNRMAAKRIGFQTPSDTKNNPLRPIVFSKLSTPYPTGTKSICSRKIRAYSRPTESYRYELRQMLSAHTD
jgi:hypothetical protein